MHGMNYSGVPPPQISASDRPTFETNNHTTRVYESWKGNNIFFFGGRLIFGPDVRSLILTLFLILVPTILFFVFIYQTGINHCQRQTCNLLLVASIIFPVNIVVLLFLTSARDPGIIPRNAHPSDADTDTEDEAEWITNHPGYVLSVPPTKDVIVNGTVLRVKYCHTCMLYRPPRCSHCSICNNCVERFDHHCPWVGQCIGKRNYRHFFMFVASTSIYCVYIFGFCCLNMRNIMKTQHCNLWKALEKSPVSGILIIYSFIGAWFVGGLTIFHVYLICTNQTTYENFRYRYDRKSNPHNLGVLRNVREIFFFKTPESKTKLRARLKLKAYSGKSLPLSEKDMSPPCLDVENRQSVVAQDVEDIRNQVQRSVTEDPKLGAHSA